jgi:hypothetical protein
MTFVLHAVGRALLAALAMFREVLWPPALGLPLSAVVRALTLGRGDAKGMAPACGPG